MAREWPFRVGERVRLTMDVAPYPLGLFPEGTTGTVTEVDPDADVGTPIAYVRLDEHFACLDDWENVLQVVRYEDESGEVTPRVFERMEGGMNDVRFSSGREGDACECECRCCNGAR